MAAASPAVPALCARHPRRAQRRVCCCSVRCPAGTLASSEANGKGFNGTQSSYDESPRVGANAVLASQV